MFAALSLVWVDAGAKQHLTVSFPHRTSALMVGNFLFRIRLQHFPFSVWALNCKSFGFLYFMSDERDREREISALNLIDFDVVSFGERAFYANVFS